MRYRLVAIPNDPNNIYWIDEKDRIICRINKWDWSKAMETQASRIVL
jgi:hypothetical protein